MYIFIVNLFLYHKLKCVIPVFSNRLFWKIAFARTVSLEYFKEECFIVAIYFSYSRTRTRTPKTEAPRHSRCGTIKILPCSPAMVMSLWMLVKYSRSVCPGLLFINPINNLYHDRPNTDAYRFNSKGVNVLGDLRWRFAESVARCSMVIRTEHMFVCLKFFVPLENF